MTPGGATARFQLSFSRSAARIGSRLVSQHSASIANRTKPQPRSPRDLSGPARSSGTRRNSRCLTFSARDTVCGVKVIPPEPDEALACLSQLASSAGELHQYLAQLARLMSTSVGQASGSYARTVSLDQRLTVLEQVSQAVRMLTQEGNRFRRLEAQALYAEGLTTAQLATVLGVSRQRASALLREDSNSANG